MGTRSNRRRVLISYAAFYLAFAATALRAYFSLRDEPQIYLVVALLSIYFLLLIVEPMLIKRSLTYLHVINVLQTGIGIVLLLSSRSFDFFSILFLPPCAISILYMPRKIAFSWIGVICTLLIATLLIHFPLSDSVGYVIVYPAAIFLVTGFSYLTLQAEEAQNRSEALLVDLQQANQKLQAYAAQVQELAAAAERNRLARELHDSVTQIIFGLTLSAQAARILLERDTKRAAEQLDHLQGLAQNALTEMRTLIQQLHPSSIAEEGLTAGLRRLAGEKNSRDGLKVEMQIHGERRLPLNIEEGLLRVSMEALNNIVKHAQTDHAIIRLNLEDDERVLLEIEDEGKGFDLTKIHPLPGHLGLTSMTERIKALGGTFSVDSKPGQGTRIRVELILAQEVEHV